MKNLLAKKFGRPYFGKRLLCLALSILLTFCGLPMLSGINIVYAFSGSGTIGDPYKISTAADLDAIRTVADQNCFFQLQSNLDLVNFGIWTSIPEFTGTFDGNNHTISNLKINVAGESSVGLFKEITDTSTIKNLTLEDVDIFADEATDSSGVTQGGANVGGIVGQCDGTIDHCSVTGKIKGYYNIGGIAGYSLRGTLSNCSTEVELLGYSDVGGILGWSYGANVLNSSANISIQPWNYTLSQTGGLVGEAYSQTTITDSYASGNITAYSITNLSGIGGLVGNADYYATISNCYTTVDIYARAETITNIGGFCGIVQKTPNYTTNSTIQNCYALGDVTIVPTSGSTYYNTIKNFAGFIGYAEKVDVSNCYSAGKVTVTQNEDIAVPVSAFANAIDAATFTDCFYDSELVGSGINNSISSGVTGKTTAEMKTAGTFSPWNFSTIWSINAGTNNGYPYFAGAATSPYTVSGTVLSDGTPVSGAAVSTGSHSTTTDASGQFSLDLYYGEYTLKITKAGYTDHTVSTGVVDQNVVLENITLIPSTSGATQHNVTGTVHENDSYAPIEGATVTVTVANSVTAAVYTTTTDALGRYTLSVPDAEYFIQAEKLGYTDAMYYIKVSGKDLAMYDIKLETAYAVTGTVLDQSSNPIAGATIYIDGKSVTTDTSGKYISYLDSGTYDLQVIKSGYADYSTTIKVEAQNLSVPNIYLTSSGTLYTVSGFVYNNASAPIDAALVTIGGNDYYTNGNGKFSLSLPNGAYSLSVEKAVYQPYTATVDVTGHDVDLGIIQLIPGIVAPIVYNVSGTISGLTASSVVTVSIFDGTTAVTSGIYTVPAGQTTTAYNFTVNHGGVYTIQVTCSGYVSKTLTVTVTSDSTNNNIVLTKTSSGGNGSSGGGSSSGGSGSTGGSGNTGNTPGSTTPTTAKFSDIDKNYSWAQSAIDDLAAKGIIKGTGNGKFEPSQNVTRADFTVLIVKALGLKANFTTNFEDISKDDYYYDAVGTAKALGIVKGVDNTHFAPQNSITRQDIMVIVSRTLKVAGKSLESAPLSSISKYSDATQVSDYAANAVAELIHSGIIVGSNDAINPQSTATRAETAVIIYKILQK